MRFDPQAPSLQRLLASSYPARLFEADGPQVHLVPWRSFDVDDILPLLEGPSNEVYYRIEQPDEGVMLFAFDESKLACWATDEPERWLGFDPRDQIVQEDWRETFENVGGYDPQAGPAKRAARARREHEADLAREQERERYGDDPNAPTQAARQRAAAKRAARKKRRSEDVNERLTKGGATNKSTGADGDEFDEKFRQALDLLGYTYAGNKGHSAAVWDVKPTGPGWHTLISNTKTNLKVSTARSLWTNADVYYQINNLVARADNGSISEDRAEADMLRVAKDHLAATGALSTAFLKPISKGIQNKILAALSRKDKAALRTLMVRDNFSAKKMGLGAKVSIEMFWEMDDAEALMRDGMSANDAIQVGNSWQGKFKIKIDGGEDGRKFGVTSQIQNKGGILTMAFRDRRGTPTTPYHSARKDESVLEDGPSRSSIRTPRKPGEGPTTVYGGFRFHKGHNKTRHPCKDVQRSIQNRLNAKRGTGKKVQKLKQWHRGHKGAEMHRQLGRYNRDNNRSEMREKIVDVRERIARWQSDLLRQGYVGESAIGAGIGGAGNYSPNPETETLDDIFEGLLRKLIVMEALDVLQDVEFDDSNGSIYLFFDPSLPGDEMDEVVKALQTEQSELALVASPDRSLPGEAVDSEWWVTFLPGKGEDGQPVVPDSQMYAREQELGSKVQMVKTGPPTSVEQLGMGIDVGKILKSMGGKK